MIGLAFLAIACTAFAMLGLREFSRRIRLVLMIFAAPFGYYVIFQMPAGGADNPLPALIGGWCLAVAFGAALLELLSLLGMRKAVGHD